MIFQRIAIRYATALFKFAEERNAIDRVVFDMDRIRTLSKESEDFVSFIHNRGLVSSERMKVIDSLFKEKLHPESLKFIYFINEKGRLSFLVSISEFFLSMVAESRNFIEGELVSSRKLEPEFVEKLTKKLSERFNKKVMLNLAVNKELIGGFVLKLGDKLFDYSIVNQLKIVEKELGGM
jgi:F-type H+-transporting ATPase subunit delta